MKSLEVGGQCFPLPFVSPPLSPGLKEVLLCKENEKHVEEIETEYIKGLTFRYVDKMSDVLFAALGIEALVKHSSNGVSKSKKGKKIGVVG